MPELPEVETVVRSLRPYLIDSTIESIKITDPRIETFPYEILSGLSIKELKRRGKYILIDLGLEKYLTVHLRMTGRLLITNNKDPLPYERVRFNFTDNMLVFDDVRKFGTITLSHLSEIETKLGPEPLSDQFTIDGLQKLCNKSSLPIKNFLLDQKKIAGLGNIYASEILHQSGVHPERLAFSLKKHEIEKIHFSTQEILTRSIHQLGTTYSTYLNADGQAGKFQNCLQVFKREHFPCLTCPGTILRIKQAGRSTFFCPNCQK
jgi:formamidopyrimidine-DNA glycosylase